MGNALVYWVMTSLKSVEAINWEVFHMTGFNEAKDLHRIQYANEDFRRHSALADVWLRPHEISLFKKYFLNQFGDILEIGCGCGRIAFGLEKNGYSSIVATDFVSEFIEEANRTVLAKCSRVIFQSADVMCLPFQDSAYNYIVCLGVVLSHLPYVRQQDEALKEIYRVMSPGGTALISVKNLDWDSWHMFPLRASTTLARLMYNPFEYTKNTLPRVGSAGRFVWKYLSIRKPQLYYFESHELINRVHLLVLLTLRFLTRD